MVIILGYYYFKITALNLKIFLRMNNKYQLEKINRIKIYLWKPSINFWATLFFSFIIWLMLGLFGGVMLMILDRYNFYQ